MRSVGPSLQWACIEIKETTRNSEQNPENQLAPTYPVLSQRGVRNGLPHLLSGDQRIRSPRGILLTA